MNADSQTNLRSVIGLTPGILRSDADIDHELIIVVQFNQSVKLRGVRFLATESKSDDDSTEASGPAQVKLFLQRPNYSFADCEAEEPTETINLTKEQIQTGEEVRVKFVKVSKTGNLFMLMR